MILFTETIYLQNLSLWELISKLDNHGKIGRNFDFVAVSQNLLLLDFISPSIFLKLEAGG